MAYAAQVNLIILE